MSHGFLSLFVMLANRPASAGMDWQGLSMLLDTNAFLLFFLAAIVALTLATLMWLLGSMYEARQDRLKAVAAATVQVKEHETKLLQLRLIGEGKLPASAAPVDTKDVS